MHNVKHSLLQIDIIFLAKVLNVQLKMQGFLFACSFTGGLDCFLREFCCFFVVLGFGGGCFVLFYFLVVVVWVLFLYLFV